MLNSSQKEAVQATSPHPVSSVSFDGTVFHEELQCSNTSFVSCLKEEGKNHFFKLKRRYKKKKVPIEMGQLIKEYDRHSISDFQNYLDYKDTKWGENQLCCIGVDQLEFSLPVADFLTMHSFWNSLKQYFKLYFIYPRKLFFIRRQACSGTATPFGLVTLCGRQLEQVKKLRRKISILKKEDTSCLNCETMVLRNTSFTRINNRYTKTTSIYHVIRFALIVSSIAKQALKKFLLPTCPKRHHLACTHLPPQKMCPQRAKFHLYKFHHFNTTSIGCPRRTIRSKVCPRRNKN